jgi:sphingolipid delta-4 desaturase
MPSNGSATVTKTPKNKASESQSTNPKHDFFWTYTEEPHRTRRLAIIKAHPEVHLTPFHSISSSPRR